MNFKITAVITVSGVKTDDDAISTLEHMISVWDEQKTKYEGLERSQTDISVKTISTK